MDGVHAVRLRTGLWAASAQAHREFSVCRESVDCLSRPRRRQCGVSEPAATRDSPPHVAILGRDGLLGGGFADCAWLELGGRQTGYPDHQLLGDDMSLVEQAIARMRNQARAAAGPKMAEAGSKPAVSPPTIDRLPEAAPAKSMTLDMNALRARGYLPEASMDKPF